MSPRLTLTARLTLLYTAALLVVLCGLGLMVTRATEAHFVDLDRSYLEDKVELVRQLMASSENSGALGQRLGELQQSHTGLYLSLAQGGVALHGDANNPFPTDLRAAATHLDLRDWAWKDDQLRGAATDLPAPTFLGGATAAPLRLQLATDTHHHTHFMADLRQSLMEYLLCAALASGLLAWWAARQGLAPLRDMRQRARRVTAHQLDERMPEASVPVEMAELAHELNTMLARLQSDFQRLSDFSSDLAHELRTPISNLLTQTQVTLAHARDAAAYRDVLASNAEEFQRLARTVSDMLLLAKTEHGLALPEQGSVDLAAEVQALFEFYEAVAEDRRLRLSVHGRGSVLGDRLMVRRAISNLLSNAIRHSADGAAVGVHLHRTPTEVTLCVQNQGPPIEAHHLPRLFDRFYRVDKSRSHLGTEHTGGTGLGLPITQAILLAHGGRVSVQSEPHLTRFCLHFPLHGAPKPVP